MGFYYHTKRRLVRSNWIITTRQLARKFLLHLFSLNGVSARYKSEELWHNISFLFCCVKWRSATVTGKVLVEIGACALDSSLEICPAVNLAVVLLAMPPMACTAACPFSLAASVLLLNSTLPLKTNLALL